jgi:outer membrane protein OmpA-like peptidoglycan-associated protein
MGLFDRSGKIFLLRTPFETLRIRDRRFSQGLTREEQRLARRTMGELRFGVECRDPNILEAAQRLMTWLFGEEPFHPRDWGARWVSDGLIDHLLRELEQQFESGRLLVEQLAEPSLKDLPEPLVRELPPRPRPRPEGPETFFEVRFVDEVGQAITALPVEVAVSDALHNLTTNAAGVALLENVIAARATVTVGEPAALERIVAPRWQTPRVGRRLKDGNTTEIVFEGGVVGPIAVKPAVPNTIVIKPPLGQLFVELWDKTGRIRHVKRDYIVNGPMSFTGVTDELGRLQHADVWPGDYTLSLTLEFFEGDSQQTDDYESPLVVLPSTSSEPETRFIGAVPLSVLVRLRLFFNTNKAFLLPTVLPSLRELRRLYEENSPSELLVVGHADTSGSPEINDSLSLDRAKSTIAFLKDDVDAWLGFYRDSIARKQRWGSPEDRLMILSLPDFEMKPKGEDAITWFQRTRNLQVDGKAGPQTRRQLIIEYMALDGAALGQVGIEIEATAHGCGENFPLDETGDHLDADPANPKVDPADRRVELFFFDPEFGIVPPPPGENSRPGSGEYPTWRKLAIETHDFSPDELAGPRVIFMELVDAHFRSNSAVVLPEGEAPSENEAELQSLTAVGAFATALRFNQENRGKKILVAGHTDTTNDVDFNQKLSEERARCALALLIGGDDQREAFKAICDKRHTVADYKEILAWVSRAFDDLVFDCDPGTIDDDPDTGVEPITRFQAAYNANKEALGATGPDLEIDGHMGPLTWGGIFDCYELALQQELGEDAAGLRALRGQLVFVDPERRALGFSEYFPVEELGVDNFRSQQNRRVEILFFDEGEEPDAVHAEADPETSEVYLPGFYARSPIDRDGPTLAQIRAIRIPMRFSRGKDFPKPNAIGSLRTLLQTALAAPASTVVVVGHTDAVGPDSKNQEVSLARALAVKAWLCGDKSFFQRRFDAGLWEWEEIQWMLHAVRTPSPCYIGLADAFPGRRTQEALGLFQLSTPDLACTHVADPPTLERLIETYIGQLGEPFLSPDSVEAVGGGSWHLPVAFGSGQTPDMSDDSPDLRRVEIFLFGGTVKPPVSSFPAQRATPTTYGSWCRRVGAELPIERPPFALKFFDPNGTPFADTSILLSHVDPETGEVAIGMLRTSSSGDIDVKLEPGLYGVGVAIGDETFNSSFILDNNSSCGAALSFERFGGIAALASNED